MTKRQTQPKNGSESAARKPEERDEKPQSSLVSPDHQTEVEEMNRREADDPLTQEEDGASDALMESYNG